MKILREKIGDSTDFDYYGEFITKLSISKCATEQAMIKIRIDVDYPYPSRAKSFLYLALRIKNRKSKDYLNNARIIAQMINNSHMPVTAYWFFTPYTIPDKRLLELLTPPKHEVALHVANKPFKEWKTLEEETNRTVKYYTIHGTQRVFARLLWGRKLSQAQAVIPSDFPLESFHKFHTVSLDMLRYQLGFDEVLKETEKWIKQGTTMSIHPEWLFERNEKNQRGPFYDILKSILKLDDT